MTDEPFPYSDEDRDRDNEIERLIPLFAEQAKTALNAVYTVRETVRRLDVLYDVELTESALGSDALEELDAAARTLRHVERIAVERVRIEEDAAALHADQPGGSK